MQYRRVELPNGVEFGEVDDPAAGDARPRRVSAIGMSTTAGTEMDRGAWVAGGGADRGHDVGLAGTIDNGVRGQVLPCPGRVIGGGGELVGGTAVRNPPRRG